MNDASKLISSKQLQAYLGVSKPTLARLRKKGDIPFVRVGGLCKYNLVEVMEALNSINHNKQ